MNSFSKTYSVTGWRRSSSTSTDGAASRRTLEDLIARYPQSEAAIKAKQRLAIR